MNLGAVDTADALFIIDACKRHPAAPAFADVVAHIELMVALADRAAALEPEDATIVEDGERPTFEGVPV